MQKTEQLLLPYRRSALWGFCIPDKTIVIPCEYDNAFSFMGDTAIVGRDGRYGAINRSGKLFIPFRYTSIEEAKSEIYGIDDDVAYEAEDIMETISPESRKIYKALFMDKEYPEDEGSSGISPEEGEIYAYCGVDFIFSNGKYRALDESISKEAYDTLSDFGDGLIWVAKNKKYGSINPSGHQVIPCMYEDIEPFDDGRPEYTYVQLNGQWGIINNRTNMQYWED